MASQRVSAASPAPVPGVTIGLFAEWAGPNATPDERTDLLLDVLAETDDATAWIEAIAPLGVDEARLVVALSGTGSTRNRRPHGGQTWRATSFRSSPTRPRRRPSIAELMLWLLGPRESIRLRYGGSTRASRRHKAQGRSAAVSGVPSRRRSGRQTNRGARSGIEGVGHRREAEVVLARRASWQEVGPQRETARPTIHPSASFDSRGAAEFAHARFGKGRTAQIPEARVRPLPFQFAVSVFVSGGRLGESGDLALDG